MTTGCLRRFRNGVLFVLITGFAFLSCTKKVDDPRLLIFHGFEKDDLKTWDPANAYDQVSLDLVPLVYETLYQYSYLSETYQLEPLLAAGMPKLSSDQLTVTIPIKKGIKYQDDPCFKATGGKGREVKAQDFVYGIKRLALPTLQSQGWWILDGIVLGANDFHDRLLKVSGNKINTVFDSPLAGVKALNDYTLQIKTIKPYPALLYILAMNFTSPVPKEAVEMYASQNGDLLDHPVGTGPFNLIHWERNRQIILEKNPNYRKETFPSKASPDLAKAGMLVDSGKPLPFLDRISIEVIKEDQPRWLNFLRGNIDAIVLPKDNFRQAIVGQVNLVPDLVKKGMHLNIETGSVIRYISFNMKDSVVGTNKYLRQALSSAIDRDEWIDIFTNGTGKKMTSAIPPGIENRPKTEKIKYDFNLTLAKELLKKAGYPNGEGLPVLNFDLRGASTSDRQFGDFISQQFKAIGVKTQVIANTFPAFLEKLKEGNTQISYGGWSMDFPDAENIYQLLFGKNQSPGPNDSNYDNPEMNKLYEKMAIMTNSKARAELIQKMDDILQEDCPWAMGYYEAEYNLSQPWMNNYRPNNIILNKFKYFKVNKEIKTRYLEDR